LELIEKSEDPINPGIVIEETTFRDRHFKVIRDDLLEAGTKQRALVPMLSKIKGEEFVYAGPVFGYAQIALALAAKVTGKRGTLFLERKEPRHPFTQKAAQLGATIRELYPRAPLKAVQQAAQDYVGRRDERTILLPFGLHSTEFIDLLYENVKIAIQKTHPELLADPPKRMWLVVGSATILSALHKLWPSTHFLCVQVGMKIWDDLVENKKHTIYVAPEKFYEKSLRVPPYPSVITYDAKLWQFVEDHGQDGDYIWNVAKDIEVNVNTKSREHACPTDSRERKYQKR